MEKIGFFEEAPNVKSSTRLFSFLTLLFFFMFNGFWVGGGNDLTGNLLIVDILLLVAVFAPKYIHKLAEMKLKEINQDAPNGS